MTRLLPFQSPFWRLASNAFFAAGLAALLGTPVARAQHAASMGHFGGGPHFAHSAPMAGPSSAHRSPHLISGRTGGHLPPFRGARPAPRNSSRSWFVSIRTFPRGSAFFASNFRFHRNHFFPSFYGWPWWGWWGWDWDSGYYNGCNSYDGTCDVGPADQQPDSGYSVSSGSVSDTAGPRPTIVVYLRDGTGYGALDYWLSNDVLHIETSYGEHKSFPLEQVDLERTGKENAQRGVLFTFAMAPMISDPGPVLAPDSYAPACPSTSKAASSTATSSASVASPGSSFGATGNAFEKGFAVTSVLANSPAAAAGLQTGDVVVRVDCQPIRDLEDLESAFAASKETVWISYLIQGSWLTDKKIPR